MTENHWPNINVIEGSQAKIVVVCDLTTKAVWERGMVMTIPALDLFKTEAERNGFGPEDFVFVSPSRPIAEEDQATESKTAKAMGIDRAEFLEVIKAYQPEIILTLGKWALRQLKGNAIKITTARGTAQVIDVAGQEYPVLPLLSPREVLRFPERKVIFRTDFMQLASLKEHGYDVDQFREGAQGKGYRWCLDLAHLLDNPPQQIAFDCETVGLDRYDPRFELVTVQITTRKGESLVVPLHIEWWNNPELMSLESAAAPRLTKTIRKKLIGQLKELLENPKVAVVGHNLKYDIHAMRTAGVRIANWYADTMQLAFVVDENMQRMGLDDCVRRWLPQFAGYADEFNANIDKSNMHKVPHSQFLGYAGGDTEVTWRLAGVLLDEAKRDILQWGTFIKVQMPALRAFVGMEEVGVGINTTALTEFGVYLEQRHAELQAKLLDQVPPTLLRAHEEKGCRFSRADFVIDCLFGEDSIRFLEDGTVDQHNGSRLKAKVWTKGGQPSTSSTDHLPYFDHCEWVRDLMELSKVSKMISTYVGHDLKEWQQPIKRTKTGLLPKVVRDILAERGYVAPLQVAGRLREPDQEIVNFIRSNYPISASIPDRELSCKINGITFDTMGRVFRECREEATGFWQYLKNKETAPRIHPSFHLHRTVTGRAASSNPNGQNLPKRGALAKAYRRIFIPTEGYTFIECDLSQAELRIAAWMAGEPEMLRIYRTGGDIHSATAAAVMGVSERVFNAGLHSSTLLHTVAAEWPGANSYLLAAGSKMMEVTLKAFLDYKRFAAKAINFGFLYGMGWRKFQVYARVEYGLTFTEAEAQAIRKTFFRKYAGLEEWHDQTREFVKDRGFVRALHGALRHLPNIESDDEGVIGGASRQSINSPVQRFASDLGLIALSRFVRDCDHDRMRPCLFIHDSNIIEAKHDCVEEAADALKWYMQSQPLMEWFGLESPIPIIADISVGVNLEQMTAWNGRDGTPNLLGRKPEWASDRETPLGFRGVNQPVKKRFIHR